MYYVTRRVPQTAHANPSGLSFSNVHAAQLQLRLPLPPLPLLLPLLLLAHSFFVGLEPSSIGGRIRLNVDGGVGGTCAGDPASGSGTCVVGTADAAALPVAVRVADTGADAAAAAAALSVAGTLVAVDGDFSSHADIIAALLFFLFGVGMIETSAIKFAPSALILPMSLETGCHFSASAAVIS